MALESRIGFAAFAVGIVVAVLALAGCDDEAERTPGPVAAGCPAAHRSHPTPALRYLPGRLAVRVVAPGVPCGYAYDFHGGTLYVELRRPSDARADPDGMVCLDLALRRRAGAGTELDPIYPGRRSLASSPAVDELLGDPDACPEIPRMQPSFIID